MSSDCAGPDSTYLFSDSFILEWNGLRFLHLEGFACADVGLGVGFLPVPALGPPVVHFTLHTPIFSALFRLRYSMDPVKRPDEAKL